MPVAGADPGRIEPVGDGTPRGCARRGCRPGSGSPAASASIADRRISVWRRPATMSAARTRRRVPPCDRTSPVVGSCTGCVRDTGSQSAVCGGGSCPHGWRQGDGMPGRHGAAQPRWNVDGVRRARARPGRPGPVGHRPRLPDGAPGKRGFLEVVGAHAARRRAAGAMEVTRRGWRQPGAGSASGGWPRARRRADEGAGRGDPSAAPRATHGARATGELAKVEKHRQARVAVTGESGHARATAPRAASSDEPERARPTCPDRDCRCPVRTGLHSALRSLPRRRVRQSSLSMILTLCPTLVRRPVMGTEGVTQCG